MTRASASASTCPICKQPHDEIMELLLAGDVRRIPDGDLAAEDTYTQRELADDPGGREPALRHRLAAIEAEGKRRRRIAARGGPLYRGRSSIPPEKIAEVKKKTSIADLIGRDLTIARMSKNRTYFHCDLHGDGRDLHPSLVAYEDQGRYHCYGSASGGDQIDWMIARHGLNFREAVEALS